MIHVIGREIKRMAGEPIYIMLMLILPLVTFGFFGAMLMPETPSDLPVAVCDQDNSSLSRTLVRMVDATSVMAARYEVPDVAAGKKLILSGKAYALLVLPANLERDVFAAKAPESAFYYNNQLMLTGSILFRSMSQVMGSASAAINFSGRQKRGMAISVARERVEPVRVDKHTLFNPNMNYLYYLYASLPPAMLMIFTMCVSAYALGSEIKYGTCGEWLRSGGGHVPIAVFGKLAPYTFFMSLMGLVMNYCVFGVMKTPVNGSFGLILVSAPLLVIACQGVALLIVSLCGGLRLSGSMISIYAGSAFAFVGVTYPAIAMPKIAMLWNRLLPLSHYMKIITDQSLRGVALRYSMLSIAALLAFAVVASLFALWPMGQLMKGDGKEGAV